MLREPIKVMDQQQYMVFKECANNTFFQGVDDLNLCIAYPKEDNNPLNMSLRDFSCLTCRDDSRLVFQSDNGFPLIFLNRNIDIPNWSNTFCNNNGKSP